MRTFNMMQSVQQIIAGVDRKVFPIAKAEQLIPTGEYCYSVEENADKAIPFNFKPCPFHSIDQSKFEEYGDIQMAGYCSHLKEGDWMDSGTGMLFDSVKACGIKL